MASPNETGDRFNTITDHIHVLGHALTELHAEINDWPDAERGLRCDTTGDYQHPDTLTAAADSDVARARRALREVESALGSAWAASSRLYIHTDTGDEQSVRRETGER